MGLSKNRPFAYRTMGFGFSFLGFLLIGFILVGLLAAAAADAGYKLNLDSGNKDAKNNKDEESPDDLFWATRSIHNPGHDWIRGFGKMD